MGENLDPTQTALVAYGAYEGRLLLEPLPDGRLMKVDKRFCFVEHPSGKRWPVPKNIIVDGASIPKAFWSVVGGPFEGKYRVASVIHDYYCDVRSRPWKDVHRVFYQAMLASGVSKERAKAMYMAVCFGGPRWSATVVHNVNLRLRETARVVDRALEKEVKNFSLSDGIMKKKKKKKKMRRRPRDYGRPLSPAGRFQSTSKREMRADAARELRFRLNRKTRSFFEPDSKIHGATEVAGRDVQDMPSINGDALTVQAISSFVEDDPPLESIEREADRLRAARLAETEVACPG